MSAPMVTHSVSSTMSMRRGQLCRVLNLVLGLGEDLAQHTSRPGTKLAKQGDVVGFELRTPASTSGSAS